MTKLWACQISPNKKNTLQNGYPTIRRPTIRQHYNSQSTIRQQTIRQQTIRQQTIRRIHINDNPPTPQSADIFHTGCEVSSRRSLPTPSSINFDAIQTYFTFLETPVFADFRFGDKNYEIFFLLMKNKVFLKFIFNSSFTFALIFTL